MSVMFFNNQSQNQSCHEHTSDCFTCTEVGYQELANPNSQLTVRQRQLLYLLSKNDNISKFASEKLIHKLPIRDMINQGLIVQTSPCNNFCAKLTNNHLNQVPNNKVNKSNVAGLLDKIEATRLNQTYLDNLEEPSVSPELELLAKLSA